MILNNTGDAGTLLHLRVLLIKIGSDYLAYPAAVPEKFVPLIVPAATPLMWTGPEYEPPDRFMGYAESV